MAPTVHYADPDGRGALEVENEPEEFVPNAVVTVSMHQAESTLSIEISDQATASESVALKDGRRRSSRLRGKVPLNDTGTGDESPSATKEASGSWKKGRRKKGMGLESVQSIGNSVEELRNDVNVEASPQGSTKTSEGAVAALAVYGALVVCASTSTEPISQHEIGEEKAAKVKRQDDLSFIGDSLSGDGGGTATATPVVEARGDFCDSNIFGDLQSIVILHPEENGILSEVPSTSKGENEEKIEMQVGDMSEAIVKKEGSMKEDIGLINYPSRDVGPEVTSPAAGEFTTLIKQVVQASRKTVLKFSKESETLPVVSNAPTRSEALPVVVKDLTAKETQPDVCEDLTGSETEPVVSNDRMGSVAEPVVSKDLTASVAESVIFNVLITSEAEPVVSKDPAGSEADLLVSTDPAGTEANPVISKDLTASEADPVITKDLTGNEADPVVSKDLTGSETEPVVSDPQEEGASRGSTSKVGDFDTQGLVNGNYDKQKEYSSVSERRAILKITSETSCLRSDGEGIIQFGKKSDSLKSVNQEIGVSDGDVAGTMKVESSVERTRRRSRHIINTAGGEDNSSGVTEGDDNTSSEKVDESVSINSKAGWVKCDDCNKWRSIPVELAEKIGATNAYWSCKQNPNKSFADCSIPQVKSNEEINKDLGISESSSCDEEEDADATCDSKPTYSGRQVNGQAVWKQIKRNIFKHRKQKHQDADEAMVCQCAPPKPGEVGCGEDCLNRMLNVECLPQQCPCGSLCTNQQFQKREYAKVELFRCGKKGHGLQAKERISRGSFVIEYVGEVLDMPSFEARQKEYSMNSQKHFYFMTLSANEVIDACSKGNYGRFINHSCDPNCQTEKWMVDGEVCIGLFAIRDVEKGEEITFDYNFVRVGGADAKKCECGAIRCRGFIGVDPDTPQNVLEIDSDDGEDPEPIMLQADSDEESDDYFDKAKGVAKKARVMSGSENVYESNSKHGIKRKFYSVGAKDVKNSKRSRRVKTAATSNLSSHRPAPPRLFSGSRFGVRNTYYSDVESKLGELTNETGGLRKQRDTAKQYLKLLVLTAASGGNVNGAAACSARDLSMLLEALLKTQKSSLLKDIMNKNGLQMFHNLIKQFRKSFEKRPILRKLLKVLDHLAKRRVLTVELIYSSPRSGTECFTDTLFDLSRHDDTEVQNMARNFRKNHVPPRPPKSIMNTERPLVKSSSQQTSLALPSPSVAASPQIGSSAVNASEQASALQEGLVEGNSADPPTTSRRKRPSRWDTVTEIGTAVAPSAPTEMLTSAAAVSLHGGPSEQASSSSTSRSHLLTASGSLQASLPVRSDVSGRPSIPPSSTGIPGRSSGPLPPVRPHQVYPPGLQPQVYPPGLPHQVYPPGLPPQIYPPGHMPVGLPGQRQGVTLGPMHLGLPRVPMGSELPPMAQRPYPGGKVHPMQGASSQLPTVGVHPFTISRGPSNQGAPSMHSVPYLMHTMGAPVYAGPPFPPPPPPLPPSGRPAWAHNGQRQLDGFPGHASETPEVSEADKGQLKRSHSASQSSSMKTASNDPGESEVAREPSVPGVSPARPEIERTASGVSALTQGPARPHEVGGTRTEGLLHVHRVEHGTRTHGHDSNVVNRPRIVTENREPIQQSYSRPDNCEGTQGRGEREKSWDTPECSNFHHHVSSMIRARVEKKHLVHYKDLEKFCSKLTEVVTRKEIKKYKENRTQGMQKVILRSKLLEKVDAYVDLQIEVYRKLKSSERQS